MDKFFNPDSIAVIGASRNPNKIGSVILSNLISAKFKGKLFPVNPEATEILGLKCYSSVLDIRQKVDLAVVSVSAEISLKVVEGCGIKKIKNIVMVTAGFSETGNLNLESRL